MKAALIVTTLLVGCATNQPESKVIEVPVPVPCVKDAPQKPSWVVDMIGPDADILVMMRAIRRDRLRARAYIGELEAVVKGCQ